MGTQMRALRRETALLLGALLVVVTLISWWGSTSGSRVSDVSAARGATATTLVTSQLEHALAIRQFLITGDQGSLDQATDARVTFLSAIRDARAQVAGRPEALRRLDALEAAQATWRAVALKAVAARRRAPDARPSAELTLARERRLDAALAAQRSYREELTTMRRADLRTSALRTTTIMVLACLLLGSGGYWVVRNRVRVRARHDQEQLRFAERQHRLAEAMAIVDDEAEAHEVLKRHIELASPGDHVTVLSRNNSDNRLEAATAVEPGSAFAEALEDAGPRDCMAIRRAQVHAEGADDTEELLKCGLCGAMAGATTCQPLLVGGKVIGSVLQVGEAPLDELAERRLRESVESAAPVLAHVRTLAIAETRAATDALTGLANRRAVADDLKRMVAQASRALSPLAVIAVDLDHFKQVNDRYGHDLGDDVLAVVGTCLRESVRSSDLVGRTGGEELVVIAPDTDAAGAAELAEKLRLAIRALTVTGLPDPITASFGVAAIPEHAVDGAALLRRADRALYEAKRNGRDRVEVANDAIDRAQPGEPATDAART